MVAPPAFQMTPIVDPFVGQDWSIDQVFQMLVKDGADEHYIFGYYDNAQQHSVIQVGRDADSAYYSVTAATLLGDVLRHLFPAADGWRFTQAAWARAGGPAMPALNQVDAILDLHLGQMNVEDNGASFACEVRRQEVQG